MKLPKDAPWGLYTQRVLWVYPQEWPLLPEILLRHYVQAKAAYATVNARFRKIDQETKKVIHEVAKELLKQDSASFMSNFPIGQIQSGGGTSTNMMVNEVLANLASVKLGKKFGKYPIHPNDHLNASQSSNDTFPGVTKLASYTLLVRLEKELMKLIKLFKKKSLARKQIKKVGRTHLQDAVIISLWDEFTGYARTLEKNLKYIKQAQTDIKELNFGGTATGSLQNIRPAIRKELIKEFSKVYKTKFIQPKNYFEQNSSSQDLARVSQSLVLLADSFIKISNDLRLLSSWPLAWFGEIILPTVQAGSSIMPGKVNPSVVEALTMICAKVLWNDQMIQTLTRQAQLELQQFMPGISFWLIESLELLVSGVEMFGSKCVAGIKPNKKRISELLEWSFAYATDYSEQLWYEKVSELVKLALKKKVNLRELLEAELAKKSKRVKVKK